MVPSISNTILVRSLRRSARIQAPGSYVPYARDTLGEERGQGAFPVGVSPKMDMHIP